MNQPQDGNLQFPIWQAIQTIQQFYYNKISEINFGKKKEIEDIIIQCKKIGESNLGLTLIKKIEETNQQLPLTLQYCKAIFLLRNKKYDESLKAIESYLKDNQKAKNDEYYQQAKETIWDIYNIQCQQDNNDKQLFQKAVEYAPSAIEKAKTCSNKRDFQTAITALTDKIKELQNQNQQNSIEMGIYKEQLALTYLNCGKHKDALDLSKDALEIRLKLLGNFNLETANACNTYASSLYYLGRIKDSLNYMQIGLQQMNFFYGREHQEIATSLNNIAFLQTSLGEYDNALITHKRALSIRLKLYQEENNSDVAISYNNIAMTYSRLKKFKLSGEYQLKSLQIWKSLHGEEHASVATALNNLAANESNMNHHDKALKIHKKTYQLRKKIYAGEQHADKITSIDNIGLTYMKMDVYEKALKYQKKAVKMWKDFKGEETQHYAVSLNNLSSTLKKFSQFELAFIIMKRSYEILWGILGPQNPTVANAKSNLESIKVEALKKHGTFEKMINEILHQCKITDHQLNQDQIKAIEQLNLKKIIPQQQPQVEDITKLDPVKQTESKIFNYILASKSNNNEETLSVDNENSQQNDTDSLLDEKNSQSNSSIKENSDDNDDDEEIDENKDEDDQNDSNSDYDDDNDDLDKDSSNSDQN